MRGASYLCASALNASHVSTSQSTLLCLPTPQWHVQNKLVGSLLHCMGCHVPWVSQAMCHADWQLGRELDPMCPPSSCARSVHLRGQRGRHWSSLSLITLGFFSLFQATGLHKTCRGTFLRPSQRPFGQHWPQDSEGEGGARDSWGIVVEKIKHLVLCVWDVNKLVCSYPVLVIFLFIIPESCTSLIN